MKMTKLFCKVFSTLLICTLVNGCSDLEEPTNILGSNDFNPGIPNPSVPNQSELSIKPVKIAFDGVVSIAVAANSGSAPTKSDVFAQTDTEYSMYSLDEDGNIKLTLFYYDVVYNATMPEGGVADSLGVVEYVETVKKEMTDAVQLVPSLITDFQKYILFSGCKYEINTLALSSQASRVCDNFVSAQNRESRNRTFVVRKTDGALFEVTGFDILRYTNGERYSSRRYEDGYVVAEDSFAFSEDGELLVLGPDGVYQVVDNGDTIEFKQRCASEYDAFVTSKYGDVFLYNSKDKTKDLDWFSPSSELKSLSLMGPREVVDIVVRHDTTIVNAPHGIKMYIYQNYYVLDSDLIQESRRVTIYVNPRGEVSIYDSPFGSAERLLNIGESTIIKLKRTNGAINDSDARYIFMSHSNIALIGFGENGFFVIANINTSAYDHFFRWSDTEYYGVKFDGSVLTRTKYDGNLTVLDEDLVQLDIPADVMNVGHSFDDNRLLLTGRFRVGGAKWSREYDLTTGDVLYEQENSSLNVVTFFKIN